MIMPVNTVNIYLLKTLVRTKLPLLCKTADEKTYFRELFFVTEVLFLCEYFDNM